MLDLVLVAQNFGTTNPVADVTGDGTVNVLDLVLVAQHFGETIPEPQRVVIDNPMLVQKQVNLSQHSLI